MNLNRRLQILLLILLCAMIGLLVQNRPGALLGAVASLAAGTVCGCMFFGGFSGLLRHPFRFIFSGTGLFFLAIFVGVLVPSTLAAVIVYPLLGLLSALQLGQFGSKFALLVVNGPCEAPGFKRLLDTATRKGIPVVNIRHKTRSLPIAVSDGAFVIVSGNVTPEELRQVCHSLRSRGYSPLIARDGITEAPTLMETLKELNEEFYQIVVSGEVPGILSARQLKVYAWAKSDATTTTAVVLRKSRRVLMIKRDHEPYKDMDSLPGGFLNVHLESLSDCSAREVMEECFVNKNAGPGEPRFTYTVRGADMVLVDVRSEPARDWRGHIVDHGYVWFVPEELEEQVLANVSAGDDAKAGSARFESIDEALANPLAFDHTDLLAAVARMI